PPTLKPPYAAKPLAEPVAESPIPPTTFTTAPDNLEVATVEPTAESKTELPAESTEASSDLAAAVAESAAEPLATAPADRERQELLATVASLQAFTAGRAVDRDRLAALHTLGSLSLDLDASVRAAAVAAIGGIASAEAIPYLERALRDRDLEVVRVASEAIARYKFYPPVDDDAGVSLPLNAAAQAEDMAAIDALENLETLSAPKGRPPVVESPLASAIDPESQERLETIAAIQAMTDGRPIDTETLQAVELLGELSLDLDATVRHAAVTAIGQIPSAEAIPYLERALRDSDSDVVGAASAAIARYKFYPRELEFEPLLPLNAAPDFD
ncbi:MAG: HEAT repeat domain-containing protein, partial [Cyanobacteria bacterium J06641_5]